MFNPLLYFVVLAVTCGYAMLRGNLDARIIAALCLAGTLATLVSLSPLAERFHGLETGTLIVDLGILAGFVAVALQSSRFWPLWVAGLQLTSSMAHLLKAANVDLFYAYGVAMAFWSYPILLILAVGTWRHRRRLKAAA